MSSIQPSTTIEAALASFDRNSIQPYIAEGERERAEIQSRFPVTSWPSMSLEAYALGHEKSKESYCYLMERATSRLGSIRGGSARKLLMPFSITRLGSHTATSHDTVVLNANACCDDGTLYVSLIVRVAMSTR